MRLSQCVTLTDGELVGDDCEFSAIATDTRSIKNELLALYRNIVAERINARFSMVF